jgi:hypothetical protein
MLVVGTDPDTQAALPSATGEVLAGVVAHQQAREDFSLAGDLMLADGEPASLVRKGRVWVSVEEAVTPGDDVFFRHTAGGGGTELGVFRTDADTASADQVAGASWLSTTAGAGIALLEINIP